MPEADIVWTEHAQKECRRRRIDQAWVEAVARRPNSVRPAEGNREIRQGRVLVPRLNRELLLRVVIEKRGGTMMVITAYLTGQLAKYEKE